jgi:centromere protein I
MLAFFEDQLEFSTLRDEVILEMLQAILEYTRYTKVFFLFTCQFQGYGTNILQTLPPACLLYLKSMIPSWNGVNGREVILGLLAYTPLDKWQG